MKFTFSALSTLLWDRCNHDINMTESSSLSKLDTLTRTKKIFYKRCADAKLTFWDGEEIQVCKALLACHSSFFYDLFYINSSKCESYLISEFDSTTFQIFLNCLMGFKLCTDANALLIFPICHKYRTEKLLKNCVEVLKPEKMSQNVCHSLNLALQYECQELVDGIMEFLNEKFNIVSLLVMEEYCSILEPNSMAKLLENIKVNAILVTIIYQWAEKYLKNTQKSANVASFMKEYNILDKIRDTNFESFQSLFDFQETKIAKELFSPKTFEIFLKKKICTIEPRRFPIDSEWVTIRKGSKLTENFLFVNPLTFCSEYGLATPLVLQVWQNEIILMDKGIAVINPVSCVISFSYSQFEGPQTGYCHNHPSAVYTFNETAAIKKDGKCVYEILCPATKFISILSFNIAYLFDVDCKILKTSMEGIVKDGINLKFFTYSVNQGLKSF